MGSDPNNPHPNNPRTASVVASNCVAVVDSFVFVFILAPTLFPRPFHAPPGEKEEPTATFGRVLKQGKYTRHGMLRPTNQIFPFPTCLSSGYFFASNTRPNRAVSSLSRPAGRERVGVRVGPKMKTNKCASIPTTHFDATGGCEPGLLELRIIGVRAQIGAPSWASSNALPRIGIRPQ